MDDDTWLKILRSRGYQWRFLFRGSDGNPHLSQIYNFGPKEVSLEEALKYTTQFVRDNFIKAYSFDYNHMK